MSCPEAPVPPNVQISFFQTALPSACAGVNGAVGVTAVHVPPSADVQTSPCRTPSITHILPPSTPQPKLSRGVQSAAAVTSVQFEPSGDDQMSFSCTRAVP